jgi:hypothetical protein
MTYTYGSAGSFMLPPPLLLTECRGLFDNDSAAASDQSCMPI